MIVKAFLQKRDMLNELRDFFFNGMTSFLGVHKAVLSEKIGNHVAQSSFFRRGAYNSILHSSLNKTAELNMNSSDPVSDGFSKTTQNVNSDLEARVLPI